jgi:hypothetical protein
LPAWQLETSSPELCTAARIRGRERGTMPDEREYAAPPRT